jgi:hypothetical protein
MAVGLVSDVTRATVLLAIRNALSIATQPTMGYFSHRWQFIMGAIHEKQREEGYPCGGKLTAAKTLKVVRRLTFLIRASSEGRQGRRNEWTINV